MTRTLAGLVLVFVASLCAVGLTLRGAVETPADYRFVNSL